VEGVVVVVVFKLPIGNEVVVGLILVALVISVVTDGEGTGAALLLAGGVRFCSTTGLGVSDIVVAVEGGVVMLLGVIVVDWAAVIGWTTVALLNVVEDAGAGVGVTLVNGVGATVEV